MHTLLIVLSSILTISAVIPYIIEIFRGTTKPRIVSWFTWSLLAAIGSVASFSDGQLAAGILAAASASASMAVVVLGYKHGDRHFERVDIVCQAAALAGVGLWFIFNSPAVAVIAVVAIDFIGCVPTFRHSWQKPHEETWITFAMSGAAGGLTLMAAGDWRITAAAYPLYIALIATLITLVILKSPNRRVSAGPAELREL